LFAANNVVNGQDTIVKDEYKAKNIEKVEKPNAIVFAPLNLFDIVNPNFQIGYELFVAKKWSFQNRFPLLVQKE